MKPILILSLFLAACTQATYTTREHRPHDDTRPPWVVDDSGNTDPYAEAE